MAKGTVRMMLAFAAALFASSKSKDHTNRIRARDIESNAKIMLNPSFGGNGHPHLTRVLNQRQKRKRARQSGRKLVR